MSHRVDLGPKRFMLLIDERVRETIEVEDPKTQKAELTALLIFDDDVSNALVLEQEPVRDDHAGVLRVVDGCVTEFSFGIRVQPAVHASLALTLASAS